MGTTTFVWDPVSDCVLMELDETDNVKAVYTNEARQYGGVLSQRRGNTSYYHHHDALGSTRFLTDSTGTVTDTYLNDAWGNSVTSTGTTVNPFKWVGKYGYYTDNSTGQVYVRARMYQPNSAKWHSIDPYWLQQAIASFYLYAANSPNYLTDPSGLWAKLEQNEFWYQAGDGDIFEALVTIANPRIKPSLNKACIIPIRDVNADDWSNQKTTPCGVYSIETLVPRNKSAPNELIISIGTDPRANEYITRATAFFAAERKEFGQDALSALGDKAKTGENPITRLIVIGHSWGQQNSIGGANTGGQLTFPLIKDYHESAPTSAVFEQIEDYFYWQKSLQNAMEPKHTVPCWLSVDADVYFVGCESYKFTGNFARHILRAGAIGHGTSRPTWAKSNSIMSWGTAVRNGRVGDAYAIEDPLAPKSTTVPDYLSQRFFGNSKGKN